MGTAVSTATLALTDDIQINGVQVGATIVDTAQAKAAAINAISDQTGVTASASTIVDFALDFNIAATDTSFAINGVAVEAADLDSVNEIVTEIPDERDIESVDDLFSSVANPEFIIKENNDNEILNESKKLNESLIKGIKIGLNDKIAFTKGLFDGSEEDFSRVVSQLQTYSSWDEAFDFLNNIVKPDYNNWEGKEEIEKRFLKCIENNF